MVLVDLDAAEQALVDPVPSVAELAAQFLALNGWQLDLEPAEDLVQLLRTADNPAALATWMRGHMRARLPREIERLRALLGKAGSTRTTDPRERRDRTPQRDTHRDHRRGETCGRPARTDRLHR